MSEIKVVRTHAGQREEQTLTTGTKAWELFRDDADVIAARVGGELRDLAHELPTATRSRASTSRARTAATSCGTPPRTCWPRPCSSCWPEARLGIGPPVENGFYYDFDVETPFVPEDLVKIETAMRKIIKANQRFERRVTTDADALTELQDEPYKIELIGLKGGAGTADTEGASVEVGGAELTIYDNVGRDGQAVWSDLCRGPHLPTTKRIPAFKLMRSAAAYWRGDEKNKQLQRIYGTAWESKEALEEHLHRIEEAERRDHRRLGRDLDLFSFPDEIGSGLPVFHPKGGVIKRAMEDYVRQRHIDEGFEYVGTPHIAKEGLFHTSGHLPYYGEGMFPALDVDGMDYRIKAMNCPMHNLIYRSRQRSYRELPLRLFEFGSVYRHEKSGVIHGLTRVRGFAQDDSHSYVTPEQAPGRGPAPARVHAEPAARLRHRRLLPRAVDPGRVEGQVHRLRRGLGDRDRRCSRTSPPPPASSWCPTRAVPPTTARRSRCRRATPSDAPGRWATVQYDFNQPSADRFNLEYVAADGTAPAAGDDPLGQVRLDRALPRRAGRALRRRLPALAGSRPGPGDPHRRAAQRLPVRRRAADEAGRAAGGGRRLRRPDAEEDPQRAAAEGAVHDDRR